MDKTRLIIQQQFRSADERERAALLQDKMDHYIKHRLENQTPPGPTGSGEPGAE